MTVHCVISQRVCGGHVVSVVSLLRVTQKLTGVGVAVGAGMSSAALPEDLVIP